MSAELYGIQSVIKESISQTPISLSTEIVFIGACKSSEKRFVPVRLTKDTDLESVYGSGISSSGAMMDLGHVTDYAFKQCNLDHVWFINIGKSGLTSDLAVSEADGVAGVSAVNDIYPEHGVVPTLVVLVNNNLHIATPGSGHTAPQGIALYANQVCASISDHFKAQLIYDNTVPEEAVVDVLRSGVVVHKTIYSDILDTDASKDLVSGKALCCIGSLITSMSGGTVTSHCPLSVVCACLRAIQDNNNTGKVPYRSVGNLDCIGGVGYCVSWIDSGSIVTSEVINTRDTENSLTNYGYIILRNKRQRKMVTWGDHTSLFNDGVDDELYRFDSNVAIAYHLANRWILKWGDYIDSPMNLALRNDIINEEQTYLDYLVSIGALIGNPKCEFRAVDNSMDTLQQGQFYFTDTYTTAIPAKYLELGLVWTSAGLTIYTEE